MTDLTPLLKPWQRKLHTIIYEAETPAGKLFDVVLIFAILLSVINVALASVESIYRDHEKLILFLEYFFTGIFTIEYVLRSICIRKPYKYTLSFYGIVDLCSVLPTYLVFIFPGAQYMITVRLLRVIRIFRILKMVPYLKEANILISALNNSLKKITVFLLSMCIIVTILGSIMYIIESGSDSGFSSIPKSIYWAIITVTTVGYGDIAPVTPLGQALAAITMLMGYAILAIPTGIVTSEIFSAIKQEDITTEACPVCTVDGHQKDARYCRKCGSAL